MITNIAKTIKVFGHANTIRIIFNYGEKSQSSSMIDCEPTTANIEWFLRELPTIASGAQLTAGEAISILNRRDQMSQFDNSLFAPRSI